MNCSRECLSIGWNNSILCYFTMHIHDEQTQTKVIAVDTATANLASAHKQQYIMIPVTWIFDAFSNVFFFNQDVIYYCVHPFYKKLCTYIIYTILKWPHSELPMRRVNRVICGRHCPAKQCAALHIMVLITNRIYLSYPHLNTKWITQTIASQYGYIIV